MTRNKRRLLVLLVVLAGGMRLTSCLAKRAEASPRSPASFELAHRLMQRAVKQRAFESGVLLVARRGKVLYHRAYGGACQAHLAAADCLKIEGDRWSSKEPLTLVAGCQTCSGGGWDVTCGGDDLIKASLLELRDAKGKPVAGAFTELKKCIGAGLYRFGGSLSAGSYILVGKLPDPHGDTLLLELTVAGATPGASDAAPPPIADGGSGPIADASPSSDGAQPSPVGDAGASADAGAPTAAGDGGCSCRAGAAQKGPLPGLLALLLLGALAARARRRV